MMKDIDFDKSDEQEICSSVYVHFLVLGSQTFALLRPLFPVKPEPPLRGAVIGVGDTIIQRSSKIATSRSGDKNERFVVRLPKPN
jgi:hypothetical protein